MYAHCSFPIFLCLLIVGAQSNCVMAHGAALAAEVEAAACAEAPIGESKTCENESGCICKGALLSEHCPALLDHDVVTNWLPSADLGFESYGIAVLDENSCCPPHTAPPLSGAFARILLQSFQI